MKCISLPGINKVWYISHDLLPYDVVYRSIAGIPITFDDDPTPINLCGLASCEVQKSFDNNSYIEKTTLIFRSLDEIPVDQHLAFVMQTVNDETYVVGALERPYPTVKITRSSGQPDGDPSVRKYEVSFTARKALALCSF